MTQKKTFARSMNHNSSYDDVLVA